MKNFLPAFGLLLALPLTATAVTDAQYQGIVRLGKLNGLAMYCRYFDQTPRMKHALIDNLPKRRQLGEAFDRTTDEAYRANLRQGRSCPSPGEFTHQVDEAIADLQRLFSAPARSSGEETRP